MTNHKNIVIIVVVTAIIILDGYFLFVASHAPLSKVTTTNPIPSPVVVATSTHTDINSAAGLKTYRNEQFGFEFQYPEKLRVEENTFGNYYSQFNLDVTIPVIVEDGEPNKTRVAHDSTVVFNVVRPEFVNTDFWRSQQGTSTIIVDGVTGIKYQFEQEETIHTTVILPFGDYKLIIFTGDGSKPYPDELNQILTSFKFL